MAENYNFHCPQFFDFEAIDDEVTSTSTAVPNTPSVAVFKTEVSVESSGQFNGAVQSQVYIKTPFNRGVGQHPKTDQKKSERATHLRRYSKSEECLSNQKRENLKDYVPGTRRKRSISETAAYHLRIKVVPETPMCLKRSKQFYRKAIKSSEELELERIAESRRQLTLQLRQNEMALKRMKLSQKQRGIVNANKAEQCRIIAHKPPQPAVPIEKRQVAAKPQCANGGGANNLRSRMNRPIGMNLPNQKFINPACKPALGKNSVHPKIFNDLSKKEAVMRNPVSHAAHEEAKENVLVKKVRAHTGIFFPTSHGSGVSKLFVRSTSIVLQSDNDASILQSKTRPAVCSARLPCSNIQNTCTKGK